MAATLITSSQIKNGTIQGIDLKNSTISRPSSRRAPRTSSARRALAATGGKVAYEVTRKSGPETQPANVIVKIATLSVPAGA